MVCHLQVLVFFTWVVRGVADSVSMWDAVERVATFVTNVPQEADVAPAPLPGASTASLNAAAAAAANGGDKSLVEIKVDGQGVSSEGEPPKGWPTSGDIR